MLSLLRQRHSLLFQVVLRPRTVQMMHPVALRPFFVSSGCYLEQLQKEESGQKFDMTLSSPTDNIIFEIQTKCTTLQRLMEFEQEKSNQLTIVQRSVLLARFRALLVEQGEYLSPAQRINAQSIFQNTARTLLRNIPELDPTSLNSTLNTLSKGNQNLVIDSLRPDSGKLVQIESHVLTQFDTYLHHDLSAVIAGLMRLGYTPNLLLEQINKMGQMSIFNKDQCVRMLEALAEDEGEKGYNMKSELFAKFFNQLEKHALSLTSYNICRAFSCLESMLKHPQVLSSKTELKRLQMRATFLVDRLSEMLSRESDVAILDLYWSNKFVFNIEKVLTENLSSEIGYYPLDLRKLQLYSVQEIQEKMHNTDPKIIINMISLFSNERHRSMLVQKTLEGLRQEKIDIRKFPLNQLSKFIQFVATYSPPDVKVFFNFVVTAFDSGYFTMNKINFSAMSQIFVMFVKSGYLSPDQSNKFLLSYILSLKNTILPGGGKEEMLNPSDIIKITWSIMIMQNPGSVTIPILPKLLEQLSSFNRPGEPLSQEELCMLHQINVYVEDVVAKDKLPKQFLKILPENIKEVSREAYEAWDQPLYPEVQREIAIKLLKLRVQFKENSRPIEESSTNANKAIFNHFKVPFKLVSNDPRSEGTVILLKGEKNVNRDTDQWHGFQGFVARILNQDSGRVINRFARQKSAEGGLKVQTVDVNHWQTLDEVSKLQLLSSLLVSSQPEKKLRV